MVKLRLKRCDVVKKIFLLFFISLNKALNLQELFRIFQKRQVFLWNFPLINKPNSINEIKKKEGVDDLYIDL
uniref:Ribosomal protein S16 n=1 Tax=Lupinus albus TaxID=3870 RepID=A0A1C7D379_LUPAL|nr:ribosomal protein S16 [Lupinus albus]AHY33149.1 ribosomal protein S16 [Lupinus albus]